MSRTTPAAATTSAPQSPRRRSKDSAASSSTVSCTRSSVPKSAERSTRSRSRPTPPRRSPPTDSQEHFMSASQSQPLPMSAAQPTPTPTTSEESNPIRDAIAEAIAEHKVILFMKGTPEAPACGFSARTVAALQALDTPFAAVDVLPDPRIRQELTAISDWPTIPQLFVDGELVGGCDIVIEMYESGELAQALL